MNYRNIVFALLVVGALGAYKFVGAKQHFVENRIEHAISVSEATHRHIEVRDASDFDFDFDFDFEFNFDEDFSDREVVLERTIDAESGELLIVNIEHSSLVVNTEDTDEVHVRVVLESNDLERGREKYESLNYEVNDTRGGVEITAKRERNRNWNWSSRHRAKITAFVTVPEEYDFDVKLSHGDAKFEDIAGDAEIRMSHGDLTTRSIEGQVANIRLSHGDYDGTRLMVDQVTLSASHGDIDVDFIESTETEASLSHGDITVESLSGELNLSNSHGDIEVGVRNLAGARFSNSHGDIDITARDALAADIDLKGGSVRIASDLSFQGKVEKNRAEGSVNGGGPDLVARTSHGSIVIRTQ